MRKLVLLSVATLVLAGCTYRVNQSEQGTIVVNRQNGEVRRVSGDTVIELPVINDPEFIRGTVIDASRSLSSGDFIAKARAKLMTGVLLWNLSISPTRADFDAKLSRLMELARSSRNSVTLMMIDPDGFTVYRLPVSLDSYDARWVNDNDEHVGYIYEGTVELSLEQIQLISQLSFKWNF